MKNLKTLLCILTLCFVTQAEAQLFKKLGKKIEKAAEKTIERKVEEKTEKETNKAFDSTFNNGSKNKKNKKGKHKKSPFGMSSASPAGSYKFSHKYTMQIDDGKNKTNLDYYLTSQGEHIGFKIPDDRQNMITIIDMNKNTMFMFMESRGNKTLMAMNANFEDATKDAINETDYSVTATGNTKTILGYKAKEYKVKGEDTHGTVWVTNQANVTFANLYQKAKAKKSFDQTWLKMVDGLPLEMNMTDTSKRKTKNIVMRCITLEKTSFSINTSDYKKMM